LEVASVLSEATFARLGKVVSFRYKVDILLMFANSCSSVKFFNGLFLTNSFVDQNTAALGPQRCEL